MYFSKDTSKRASFVIVPVFSSAPETGVEVGGSALYSFYTDTTNKNTHVSNVFGYASITTKDQTNLTLSSAYWYPGNSIHLSGVVSYLNYPFNFYGIGNATSEANQNRLGERRFKLNFEVENRVGDYLFLGVVGGGFDYEFSDSNPAGIYYTDATVQGKQGGPTIFGGPSVIFDSRNNNTYTTSGTIVTAYLNLMQGMFSNSDYQGGFFNIEYSGFFSINKQLVLGLDVQEQSLVGGQSPFYLLPALGSDEMMRGYYNGRFRDRNFLAGQTELRYRISKRFGQYALVILSAVTLAACSGQKVPAEKLIAEIQSTVTAASDEAAKYIPDQLVDVQTKLSALKASFEKKDYAAVVTDAPAVLGAAQSLATDAATKKDEVLKALNDKWTALAGSVPGYMTSIQNRIDFLSKKSNKKAAAGIDLDGAKSGLSEAMSLWSKAQAAFAGGNMDEAVTTAQDVKKKTEELAAALKLDLSRSLQG